MANPVFSEKLTSFEREYLIGDGNRIGYGFGYKVIITHTSIVFEFGNGENRVAHPIRATFENEIFVYGNIEVLTVKVVSKMGTEIKFTVAPPFDMEQVFAMIGAGFGVFTLKYS